MSKKSISLANLYNSISSVSVDAVLNQLNFRHASLRNYLRRVFSGENQLSDGFLADPVIEATFGWHSAVETMHELAEQKEISPKLVDCMDGAFAPDTEKQKKKDQEQKKTVWDMLLILMRITPGLGVDHHIFIS